MLKTALQCARCGREAPEDPDELARWRYGKLALEGDVDVTEGLLLCPDCDAEDRAREFEEGEGG
jgi:hypothetical protein